MDTNDVLSDAFGRIRESAARAVEGLSADQLAHRVGGRSNSIGWLVWHLTRVQDDHIAAAAGSEQVWTAQGWVERFGLPFDPDATGYGFRSDQVDAVRVASPELLVGYLDAVHRRTLEFVAGLRPGDLDRIVDESFDPPVSLGVRLVSIIDDDLEHAGQAAFVRGLVS